MEFYYRNATVDDIDFLVKSRLDFINVACNDPDYSFIESNLQRYFKQNLHNQTCDAILAENGDAIVGTGIMFYYNSVPSRFNPLGKNAYIACMFVDEAFRCQGIGFSILDRLVQQARAKDYHIFILQESEMGRPLYQKYGFSCGKAGMILKYCQDKW